MIEKDSLISRWMPHLIHHLVCMIQEEVSTDAFCGDRFSMTRDTNHIAVILRYHYRLAQAVDLPQGLGLSDVSSHLSENIRTKRVLSLESRPVLVVMRACIMEALPDKVHK